MSNPLNILILADYSPGDANVVRDFLYAFVRNSAHRVRYAFWPRYLGSEFDFNAFDVVVIFWAAYFPSPPGVSPTLPANLAERLRASSALKVLFRQDEHWNVNGLHEAMEAAGINVMFTCVDEHQHEIFYPGGRLKQLEGVHTVLTGYVPEYLENVALGWNKSIRWDIGYRSRAVPLALGDLGQEKVEVCRRFAELALPRGFSTNVSVLEQQRIYGSAWIDFLRSTRFQLGTPSGASVIDFTGEIAAKVADYLHQHPGSGYAEVKQRFFADVDGKIVIDTLSPRVFEYTATGNVMVMHEGAYGGIVSPDVHYIPVRKDYSNIDEVFDKMRDPGFCATLAKRARADLIESRVFSYAKFVARFDRIVEAQRAGKVVAPGISAARFYAQRFVSSRQRVVLLGSREIVLRLPQWRSIPFIGPAVEPMVRREQLWRTRLQLLLQIATRRGGAVILAGEFARFLVGVGGDSRLRRAVLRELLLWSALDVAVRGRSGYSPFWLEPSLSGSTLKLESRNVGIPQVGNSLEVLAQARALMRQGKLQRVLWEHRIEGGELSWSYGGRRRVVRLEDRGMVCFESAIRHAAFWHTLSEHLRAQPPS